MRRHEQRDEAIRGFCKGDLRKAANLIVLGEVQYE
jgi:hypothetical protein